MQKEDLGLLNFQEKIKEMTCMEESGSTSLDMSVQLNKGNLDHM